MWIEAKVMLDLFAFVLLAIVMAMMLSVGAWVTMFLIFMAIGLVIFSDLIYGWKTTQWWVKPWVEAARPNQEVALQATISGGFAARFVDIKEEGKREWVQNKKEAACVNHGDYQLRTPNGNPAFIAHEDHDENINLNEARYATEICNETGTDRIQDVYHIAKKEDENICQEEEKTTPKLKTKLTNSLGRIRIRS